MKRDHHTADERNELRRRKNRRRSDKRRKQQKELLRRKRRIEHRLRDREWKEQAQPMFRSTTVDYELAEKTRGMEVGGIGVFHDLAQRVGLVDALNSVPVLKRHLPYWESDHALNIAYNHLSGGTCIEDLELRRQDDIYLDALGAQRIPDPTTAGDYCRRFKEEATLDALQDAINVPRLKVWKEQPDEFFDEAFIDGDGTLAPTTGACKKGIDMTFKGVWGYHPLLISLANTQEPLFLANRPGNRPSHEGAARYFDKAIALTRKGGFRKITLRGDTDFSQTKHLDRWEADNVRFIFGFDASAVLKKQAAELQENSWRPLDRPKKYTVATEPRSRPENVKQRIVEERGYRNIRLKSETVAEFDYTPTACKKSKRIVVLRKNLSITQKDKPLIDDIRYFFYITADWETPAEEVVVLANQRCDQENVIGHLKDGVKALRMPTDSLHSNWAYMIMASLAWTLKAWFALLLPAKGRWKDKHAAEKRDVLRMGFKKFLNGFVRLPCQLVVGGRRGVLRLLSWNPWLHVFLRGVWAVRLLPC